MIIKCGIPWIATANMIKSKQFFIDILGGIIYEENKDANWVEVAFGNTYIGIHEQKGIHQNLVEYSVEHLPGQNAVISFEVDNIQEFFNKLKLNEIICQNIVGISNFFSCFVFYDYDGNKLQAIQFV